MKNIIIALLTFLVLPSISFALVGDISCNDCFVGTCECTITDCTSGLLEVFSGGTCGSQLQYQLEFSQGTVSWSPTQTGTFHGIAFCDSGAQSTCQTISVTAGGGTTTTTTVPLENFVINITNNELILNADNEIKVLLGDEQCRLDRNSVDLRYTTILPIKIEPQAMVCADEACVMSCTYDINPLDNWVDPLQLSLIVGLTTGLEITEDKELPIIDPSQTTTTTTVPGANATTTTTQPGATTTTTMTTSPGALDLAVIVPDLRALQQDLNSVSNDANGLADKLREIGDIRFRTYRNVAIDIDDATDKIDVIVTLVNNAPNSESNRQRVVNDLGTLKNSLQAIAENL